MEILKNVLSIDKIKHLQELGVNTGNASMTWMLYPYEEGKQPQLSLREWRTFKEPFRKEHCIPAFTLLDILELLPKEIETGTDTYWVYNDVDVNLDVIHKATVNELIEHFKTKEEQ